jgi:hypothetical protein
LQVHIRFEDYKHMSLQLSSRRISSSVQSHSPEKHFTSSTLRWGIWHETLTKTEFLKNHNKKNTKNPTPYMVTRWCQKITLKLENYACRPIPCNKTPGDNSKDHQGSKPGIETSNKRVSERNHAKFNSNKNNIHKTHPQDLYAIQLKQSPSPIDVQA